MIWFSKKKDDATGNVQDDAQGQPAAGLFARLSRSRQSLQQGLGALLGRRKPVDDRFFDDLEDELVMADLGVDVAAGVISELRGRARSAGITDSSGLLSHLRDALVEILESSVTPAAALDAANKPFVILMVGVNGVGKTTSTAKLGAKFKAEGKDVMLAACDTFRAAATEQLQHWGERIDVPVVAQGHGADAAAVAHDALESAKSRQVDVLLVDTAGRQHTHGDLMEQLSKVDRVIKKIDPSAPHEVLLTVDAATGQNALTQVSQFNAKVPLTGLIVTKLDGTAKGGIVVSLAKRYALPIRFIGVGEAIDDLREFDPKDFVAALLPDDTLDSD